MCGDGGNGIDTNEPVAGSPDFHATLGQEADPSGGPRFVWGPENLRSISYQAPPPPDTAQLEHLDQDGATTAPFGVILDDFAHMTFADAYIKLDWVDDDVAPGFAQGWAEVGNAIIAATDQFQTDIAAAEASTDRWQGATHDAALQNVNLSYPVVQALGPGAKRLGTLAGTFSTTMAATRNAIVPNFDGYQMLLNDYPERSNDIINAYNDYAQQVLQNNLPPSITKIAQNNPGFNSATTPTLGGPIDFGPSQLPLASKIPGASVGGPSGAFGGGGGGLGSAGGPAGGLGPLGGLTTPKSPFTALPSPVPLTSEKLAQPIGSTNPTTAPGSSPLSALSDLQGLNGLASPLQSALGQAANAARPQGNPGAVAGGAGMPPEGVLGLGPKGSPKAGGAAGGGAGARPVPIAKPASAPATAASGGAARPAPVSRAGLIGGAGAAAAGPPGAGAPGGGQRGGGEGSQHQPSRALKKKKHGEQIIGAADAVVAVLGELTPAEAAQPGGS